MQCLHGAPVSCARAASTSLMLLSFSSMESRCVRLRPACRCVCFCGDRGAQSSVPAFPGMPPAMVTNAKPLLLPTHPERNPGPHLERACDAGASRHHFTHCCDRRTRCPRLPGQVSAPSAGAMLHRQRGGHSAAMTSAPTSHVRAGVHGWRPRSAQAVCCCLSAWPDTQCSRSSRPTAGGCAQSLAWQRASSRPPPIPPRTYPHAPGSVASAFHSLHACGPSRMAGKMTLQYYPSADAPTTALLSLVSAAAEAQAAGDGLRDVLVQQVRRVLARCWHGSCGTRQQRARIRTHTAVSAQGYSFPELRCGAHRSSWRPRRHPMPCSPH